MGFRRNRKRARRIKREMHRFGSRLEGHGWAHKQAVKHKSRGRSTSQRKRFARFAA